MLSIVSASAQQIPPNAKKAPFGSGWICDRGFQKMDSKCLPVVIPENAQLDVYGSGWTCKRGFRNERGKCVGVVIPENAQLDVYGSGWACKQGFKKAGETCQKMSPSELAAAEKLMQEFLARRRQLVGSGNTYTSSRGAQFTIRVDDADLDCSEGFSRGYDSCEVEVEYSISSNYNGNDTPSVEVSCEVDISYTDKSGFGSTKSEEESDSVYMSGQTHSGSVEIRFSFSLEEAIRVRITSVECEIESVY